MSTERMTAAQYRALQAGGKLPKPDAVPKRKPSHTKGQMNRLEQDYAMRLEALKRVGEVQGYLFESTTLRLAPDTTYTPDFLVVTPTGVEFHEVKGAHTWEDSWVKFKIAAALFPWARFFWCQKIDGQWSIVERNAK